MSATNALQAAQRYTSGQLAFREFQQAVQQLANTLLDVGTANRNKPNRPGSDGTYLTAAGYLGSLHEDEMAAVQLVQPTAEQQAIISRAHCTALEKCLQNAWQSDLTPLQYWALVVAANMEQRQRVKRELERMEATEQLGLNELLGADCPVAERRLFEILCDGELRMALQDNPIEKWEELWPSITWSGLRIGFGEGTIFSEDDLVGLAFPSNLDSRKVDEVTATELRRRQENLRRLEIELNLRLQGRNVPLYIWRPSPRRVQLVRAPRENGDLLGNNCPKLQRRLFAALVQESSGLKEREVLEIVYPGEIQWGSDPPPEKNEAIATEAA